MEHVAGSIGMEKAVVKEPNKWIKLAEMFREVRSGNTSKAMKTWKEIVD